MFKSLKKKPEKAKEAIDFKLKFHATRVPLQGWEKLVISVVSLETGKAVVKTARAVVKNGNCQWQDPIIASTQLRLNQKTNEHEEKFYKLVVSSGSSRAGILGEALINLGEFADFNHPAQRALPLKECNSGTVLHITITCLTMRSSKREPDSGAQLDAERDSSFGERDQGSEDNGLVDDLDNSESGSNGQLNKERNISQSNLRYSGSSFDSLEVPSTPGTNSPHTHSPHGNLQGSSYRGGGGDQEPRSPTTARSPNKHSHRRTLSSSAAAAPIVPIRSGWHGRGGDVLSPSELQGEDALRAALEAAQSTVEELHMEAETAQRQAEKLGINVERLNHKLEVQILSGKEMGMEMSALAAERDQLKEEVERLLLAKQTSQEQELNADNARWAAEEARRSIKELNEEIMFEKEMTKNLNLQLRKMQDANRELVLEIEDLEKALEQQQQQQCREEENGTNETPQKSPEAVVSVAETTQWHQQLAEKEDENRELQARIVGLEQLLASERRAVAPKEISSADAADAVDAFVQSLQGMVKVLQQDVEELEAESNGLTDEIRVLKSKLDVSDQELREKDVRIIELETSYAASYGDGVTVSKLENNNHGGSSDKLERAKEMANAVLVQQLMESMAALEKELQEVEEEVRLSRLRIEDLEEEKMLLSRRCRDIAPAAAEQHETQQPPIEEESTEESTRNRKSEKWAVEVEAAEAALEAELADFEKARSQMVDRISELEAQMESQMVEQEELRQREEAMSALQNQAASVLLEKDKLEAQLGAASEELETHKSARLRLEERVGQLTGEVAARAEENKELRKRTVATDEDLQRMMAQAEELRGEVSAHTEVEEGLRKGATELEARLRRALKQVEQLTGQVSYHLEAKQALQKRTAELEESLQRSVAEAEWLAGEVSGRTEANEGLQKRVRELEERAIGDLAAVTALEAQVTQLQTACDEQGARYRSELERVTQLVEAERREAEDALQRMSSKNAATAEILLGEVARLTKQLSAVQDQSATIVLQAGDLYEADDRTLQQQAQHDAEEAAAAHVKGEQNGPLSSNGAKNLSRDGVSGSNNGKVKLLADNNILDEHEAKEWAELQEKVLQLEVEVQSRSHKIESMIRGFEEKESLLLSKIAGLELAKEQIEEGAVSDLEQLRIKLQQLQKQNDDLSRQGSELRSQANNAHRMLQSEVEHLREVDEKHDKRLKEQAETAPGDNIDERVLLLETELVEAIEAKNMYKVQLQSAIAQQHNGYQDAVQQGIGNVDQLIELQKRTKSLEAELRDMQDRYSSMSLRFAEVEAQREELVMVVRNLRSGRR